MMVKEDKIHSCYHFFELLENLKQMPAGKFAEAIKGKAEGLAADTAYDLLFNAPTRFKSIQSFRDTVFSQSEDLPKIRTLPILLLDPIKVISNHKFKYALEQCPRNPGKRQNYKKQFKEKNNLTTS